MKRKKWSPPARKGEEAAAGAEGEEGAGGDSKAATASNRFYETRFFYRFI